VVRAWLQPDGYSGRGRSNWLCRSAQLGEFLIQFTAFDNTGIAIEHAKSRLRAIAPEVDVELVTADMQIANDQVGQPFRKQRVDVEPVARRVWQKTQHCLREHEGGARRPRLRHVGADVLHWKAHRIARECGVELGQLVKQEMT